MSRQKGFSLIFILLGIALVIGLAGGVYYLRKSQVPTPQLPNSIITPQTPQPTAEKGIQMPNKLVVTRQEDKIDHLSAFTTTITDTSKIKLLYADIYALPVPPKGVIHCPIDFFARYTLDFYKDGTLILHAIYDPTGCRTIQIENQESKIALTGSFSADFQQVLELSDKDFYGSQYPVKR